MPVAPLFLPEYQVVALDLSGHGDSGRRKEYPRELWADEVMAVAELVGVNVPVTPSELIDMSRVVAGHRTSMLQDLEAGRSVELDTILFAVIELVRRFDFPTPTLNMIGALAAQRAELAGCYRARNTQSL